MARPKGKGKKPTKKAVKKPVTATVQTAGKGGKRTTKTVRKTKMVKKTTKETTEETVEGNATTRYAYRPGMRFPVAAQIVGEYLDKLKARHGGSLTAEELEKAARSKGSPVHACFEWKQRKAAYQHRLYQARTLLRSCEITIVIGSSRQKTRELRVRQTVFDPVARGDRVGAYVSLPAAVVRNKPRTRILDAALAELRSFRRKYSHLVELAEVIDAIDGVL